MATRTAALRRAIEQALPDRPFSLEFWEGDGVPATQDGAPTIRLCSPQAVGHLLRAPGQLGLGRAYVRGDLEVDDLDGVIGLLGRWDPPPMGPRERARLALAALQASGLQRPPRSPAAELPPSRRRHTPRRDAEAVRHHYDVSNEFFALFLDESMTYSCALFADGAETLEEAQRAKLELICRKLAIEPGQRVLDIGCGWGSFPIHAASEHGASVLGITLSEPQAALAKQRTEQAGVADRVEIRVMDYRDLGGERFDAVVSIGMVEHVGEANVDRYAATIGRVLEPDGRVLNHGITAVGEDTHIGGEFSERYVFPGAELLTLSRTVAAFERARFEPLHAESLHRDYIETLRHWAARLDERFDEAERLVGPERVRVWRLYLRAARNGFETGQTSVFQLLCGRPISAELSAGTGAPPAPARRPILR